LEWEIEGHIEDRFIKEDDRVQRLILSGCCDISFHGKVGEESFDLSLPHHFGVFLVMKQDESADPSEVTFLGPVRIMFTSQGCADLVEEFRLMRRHELAPVS